MRDTARDEFGTVGAVNAHDAAAGPVRQDRRAGARPERHGSVERVTEVRQLLAHVELAAGGGPARLPDPDGRAEDDASAPPEHRPERPTVDHEPSVYGMESAERVLRDPTRRGVGQDREPYGVPRRGFDESVAVSSTSKTFVSPSGVAGRTQ